MDPAMAIEAAALARQQPMLDALAQGDSEVQRFYKNCVVFITGGTGFLGKQLIEKLFRCCQISKVYMLLRSKRGKDFKERILDMVKDPTFDTLYKQQPNFVSKIIAVEGDVAEIKLGIKHGDWKTVTEEVDVIFHVAATTKFDEPIRSATLINIRGTRETILLGKACKKLRSYVHVSTAYSHGITDLTESEIEEKFYYAPVDPKTMILMAESIETERLNNITFKLIKGWPNTYTFTKAIAEELVRKISDGLPICIVRPAIVLGTYREPLPGWIDQSCVYGASGLVLGCGLGAVHTILGRVDAKIGFVPCDYVNNALIVAAKETASSQTKGGNDTKIYTACSTNRNPVTLHTGLVGLLYGRGRNYVSPKSIYYLFVKFTTNIWLFSFLTLIYHMIPAYIADSICALMGKPRRFLKLAKKLFNINMTLSHFLIHEWNFVDDNLSNLFSSLSKQDKAIFNFDMTNIAWEEYSLIICMGLRKYIVKDGLKNTDYGVKKIRFFQFVHYTSIAFAFYFMWKFINFMLFMGNRLLS